MSQIIWFKKLIDDIVNNKKYDSNAIILEYLFENQEIKSKYLNEIRRYTIIWQIANEIFALKWIDEKIDIKAIWDIDYPENLKSQWQEICKNALNKVDTNMLVWYDINSQWDQDLRKKVYELMELTYDFSNIDFEQIDENMFFCYWWSDWFSAVIEWLKTIYKNKKINFIFPEASFLANIEIAKTTLWADNLVSIPKPQQDNFFLDFNQIEKYLKEDSSHNILYITPVWNPSWELIDPAQLIALTKQISKYEKITLIFDNVYVSLLETHISKSIFKEIFEDENIKNKIIVCESMSKTFGTTGIRIAWTRGFNKDLMLEIRKINSLHKAGFSKLLVEFLRNILWDLELLTNFQKQSFKYWSDKRIEFYKKLKTNFSEFFDFDASCKVTPNQWIYLFLKIKDSADPINIFIQTKAIWVTINLSDGTYIRYAFGNAK